MGQGLIPIGMIATSAQAQAVRTRSNGSRTGSRRRRKRASSAGKRRTTTRRRRTRSATSRGKFVKGSAAAKRHMARLRKMRRK